MNDSYYQDGSRVGLFFYHPSKVGIVFLLLSLFPSEAATLVTSPDQWSVYGQWAVYPRHHAMSCPAPVHTDEKVACREISRQ